MKYCYCGDTENMRYVARTQLDGARGAETQYVYRYTDFNLLGETKHFFFSSVLTEDNKYFCAHRENTLNDGVGNSLQ